MSVRTPDAVRAGGVPTPRRRNAAARRRNRAGFTLVEMLVSVAIVGILAGLAIPNMKNILLRARATQVAGDMEVVRTAVLSYNGDKHAWPSETGPGAIPPELVPYLPANYSFDRDGYELDFENWNIPGGLPGDPGTRTLIGVSVVVTDPLLGNALVELLGSAIIFSVGDTHTVVIDRS
jgi:prepilin-type N-terminal cleavage/methylation domain-containing protein